MKIHSYILMFPVHISAHLTSLCTSVHIYITQELSIWILWWLKIMCVLFQSSNTVFYSILKGRHNHEPSIYSLILTNILNTLWHYKNIAQLDRADKNYLSKWCTSWQDYCIYLFLSKLFVKSWFCKPWLCKRYNTLHHKV